MAMDPSWYLRKYEGGGIFGPLPFDQLSRWASKARVAPRDLVSSDQQNWMKAPMVSELGMDWLVEVTSERYYGPTTLGAINEFVRLGEVTTENFVINTCDGSRRKIQEIASFFTPEAGQTLLAQAGVFSTQHQQLLVRSAFDNPTPIQDQNLIGMHDGRQPMCDHDRSSTKHQILQRLLNQSLRRGVNARGRFIQNQNWRIFQERARNREPLFLSHAQLHSTLAHHATQSISQQIDETMSIRCLRRFHQFLVPGTRFSHLQVLANGAVKK